MVVLLSLGKWLFKTVKTVFKALTEEKKNTPEKQIPAQAPRRRKPAAAKAVPQKTAGKNQKSEQTPSSSSSRSRTSMSGQKKEHSQSSVKPDVPVEQKVKPTAQLRWQGIGEPLNVGVFRIENPITYWSDGAPIVPEASCIDVRLKVVAPAASAEGSPGYWPEYAQLLPWQRSNYLAWMAGDRKGPLPGNDDKYAFLYLYGLERRVLVDRQSIPLVIGEALRLLETYASFPSLSGQLVRFITYSLASVSASSLQDKWFFQVFDRVRRVMNDDLLSVILAWFFKHNRCLPVRYAYEVARLDVRSSRSVVVSKVSEQFRVLFEKKYAERFGEGLLLKTGTQDRVIEYKPSNPSLLPSRTGSGIPVPSTELPGVLGLQSQFTPLVQIWSECIEELRNFSKEVNKGTDTLTREAYRALPEALREEVDHPDRAIWERIVAEHVREDGIVLVPISLPASRYTMEQKEKLPKKQGEELAEIAQEVGFMMVPDTRLTGRLYGWNDTIALVKPEDRAEHRENSIYLAAMIMLELGIAVAAADNHIEDSEITHIHRFLESQLQLDNDTARCLDVYREILILQPPAVKILSKKLQTALSPDQRVVLGQFLVGMAALNGIIEQKELVTLRSIYKVLGIELSTLEELLLRQRTADGSPIRVQTGKETEDQEILKQVEATSIVLDEELLRRIMEDTQEVSRMLGEAMQEDEEEEDETEIVPITAVPPESVTALNQVSELVSVTSEITTIQVIQKKSGATAELNPVQKTPHTLPSSLDPAVVELLDRRYHAALAALLTKEEWQPVEFETLARSLNLMPAGMLDTINAWSDENLGDFLVEEGDMYRINTALLSEQLLQQAK